MNVDLEEYLKYYCEDHQRITLDRILSDLKEEHKREIEVIETESHEILREQLEFAKDLIEELNELVGRSTRMKDFKENFYNLMSNTSFEI